MSGSFFFCDLCSRDGSKGIGGSQDRLVIHNRLRRNHGNAPHLMTHLRRELVTASAGEEVESVKGQDKDE